MDEIKNRLLGTYGALVSQREGIVETMAGVRGRLAAIDRQIADCTAAARLFEIELPMNQGAPDGDGTVKSIILARLQSCPSGFKVRDHRTEIERLFGRAVHEKTIGVALRRLMLAGEARREGHTWFPRNAH